MKGDFTRFRSGNEKEYTSVLKQQGRVDLDSDWNEMAAIDDWQRRERTMDTIGDPAFIGDAFQVTYVPELGDFVVKPGRGYVGGHMVEHSPSEAVIGVTYRRDGSFLLVTPTDADTELAGSAFWLTTTIDEPVTAWVTVDLTDSGHWRAAPIHANAFDDAPDEGTASLRPVVSYLNQRVDAARDAAGRPLVPGNAVLLVLDVWQRHITAVEDRGLLEEALGGPDTTTRLETAWALRLLPLLPEPGQGDVLPSGIDVQCSDDHDALITGWITHRTTGRLTAYAEPGGDIDDPCLLPTDPRYRGLENRLYRIEVHAGAATLENTLFKWSRHNAAAVTEVTKVEGAEIAVADLGRDALGIRDAPLIELFDIVNERTPSPGLLRQPRAVIDVSEPKIEFETDVSTADGRAWDAETWRARRWDGLLKGLQPGVEIDLDDGIRLSFAEGRYAVGDYWLFAARVNTGSIEELQDAEPVGVRHWAAKLAVAIRDEEEGFRLSDCRPCFKPLVDRTSECQPLITVGECGDVRTLHEAVRRAHDEAFLSQFPAETIVTIQLLQGEHRLDDSVEILRSHIRVTGCGPQSRIVCSDAFSAFLIGPSGDRRISDIEIDSLAVHGTAPRGLIAARSVVGLRVHHVLARLDATLVSREGAAAIVTSECIDVAISDCDLEGMSGVEDLGENGEALAFPQFGTVSIDGRRVDITRNHITGAGIWCRHGARDIRIEDNDIVGKDLVRRSLGRSGAGVYLGELDPSLAPRRNAADAQPGDLELSDVHIANNRIADRTGSGIAALAPDAIKVNYPELVRPTIDISVGDLPVADLANLNWCFPDIGAERPYPLNRDRLASFAAAGAVVPRLAKLKAVLLWSPILRPLRMLSIDGAALSPLPAPSRIVIRDNEIVRCAQSSRPDRRVKQDVHGGIILSAVQEVAIHRNRILDNGPSSRAVGVWISDATEVELVDNEIEGNGRRDPTGPKKGPFRFWEALPPGVVTNWAGMEMLGGESRDGSVSVSSPAVPGSQPGAVPVIALAPGLVLGHPIEANASSTLTVADGARSRSLKMSFLSSVSDPQPIEATVGLVNGTSVRVEIDPKSDFRNMFDDLVDSITLTPGSNVIIEDFDTSPSDEPELIQGGVVVVGLSRRNVKSASGQSLTVDRNSIRVPAGPALAAHLVGDGSVSNNLLVSAAYAPVPNTLRSRLGGSNSFELGACVAVSQHRYLDPWFVFPVLLAVGSTRNLSLHDPSLRFVNNHVQLVATSDQGTDVSIPAVVSLRARDVQVGDNVVEALLESGDLHSNVSIKSSRARIVANRFAESPCSTTMSLEHTVAETSIVTGNQADHKLSLAGSGAASSLVTANQVELASCEPPKLQPFTPGRLAANLALPRILSNSLTIDPTAEGQLDDPATAFSSAISNRLVGVHETILSDRRADAARSLVKAVGVNQLTVEALTAGGAVDPSPATAATTARVADLVSSFEDARSAVDTVRSTGSLRPPLLGGVARFADGAFVRNTRLIIERDGARIEDVTSDPAGRFDPSVLGRLNETIRGPERGTLRFVLEDERGTELDAGELSRPASGTAVNFDFLVNRPGGPPAAARI